jgi:hypothetical protein
MDNALNQTHERESRMFRDQLVTVGDFLDMKDQLLAELKKILKSPGTHAAQKWLKAFEVRKLLKISAGKLQYLRDKGEIPFTKLGGVTYYDVDKIEKMMET